MHVQIVYKKLTNNFKLLKVRNVHKQNQILKSIFKEVQEIARFSALIFDERQA